LVEKTGKGNRMANGKAMTYLDQVAHEMEVKWGEGRLQKLVTPALADRFKAQQEILDGAISAGDAKAIDQAAAATARAWQVLDGEAAMKGCLPINQLVWKGTTPSGRKVIILRESSAIRHADEMEGDLVLTMDEVMTLNDGFPETVLEVKATFKAAEVTAVLGKPEEIDWEIGDEIPF
jgi:hypothetical protein